MPITQFVTVAFLLTIVYTQEITLPPSAGHTLDICTDSSDCIEPRTCVVSTIPRACSSESSEPNCSRCIPPQGLRACTTADDCSPGESCFANPTLPLLVCMSEIAGPDTGAKLVGDSAGSRFTLEICSTDSDCVDEQSCKFLAPGVTEDCENRTNCKCLTLTPVSCADSQNCPDGEVCSPVTGLENICVSKVVASEAGITPVDESTGADVGLETNVLPAPNQGTAPPSTDTPILSSDDATDDTTVVVDILPEESNEASPGETADSPVVTVEIPRPGPPPSGNGTNLVLESCVADMDCLPPRRCLSPGAAGNSKNSFCNLQNSCFCGFLGARECVSDDECVDGEVCSPGATPGNTCLSKAVIDGYIEQGTPLVGTLETDEPLPEVSGEGEEEEGVCVDARLLSHLRESELVFSSHRRARVLCDESGSCATSGHMVKHLGRGMMMRRYCAKVGCIERVMMVNSPKRRRGADMATRTEGLLFTAFAARYSTSLEEVVLRVFMAIHQ